MAISAERQESNALDLYLKPIMATLPDGRHFALYCTGTGSPTAILDASLALPGVGWRKVQLDFGKVTRTCSFDRAGLGSSDAGPSPRDSASEVSDLHAALAAAGIAPPYLMVGHSYGGLNARLFTYTYTKEVVGMLLIDPGFEHQNRLMGIPAEALAQSLSHETQCLSRLRAGKLAPGDVVPGDDSPCIELPGPDWSKAMAAKLIEDQSKPTRFETVLQEETNLHGISADEVTAKRHNLGNMPIIVLSQDKAHFNEDLPPGIDGEKRYAAWIAGHEDNTKDSTRGEHMIVEGADHFIWGDRKDVVLDKFHKIVDLVRMP